jgi:hypothetical protein
MQIYERNVNYANELANYLQVQDWKQFFTLTTGYELTLKSSRRLVERFHDRAKYKVCNGVLRTFWVAEKFEVKDGYHIHGLLDYPLEVFPGNNDYEVLTEVHQIVSAAQKTGQRYRASFLKYDPARSAGRYCSKYLLKRYSDYDLLT